MSLLRVACALYKPFMHLCVFFASAFRWFFLRLLFRVGFGFGLDFVGMGETVFSLFGVSGVELV